MERIHPVDVSPSKVLHHNPLQGQSLLGCGAPHVAISCSGQFFLRGGYTMVISITAQHPGVMKVTSELPQNNFDRTHHSLQFDLTRQAMCCIREARLSYSSISICRNSSHISGFDAPFVSRERRLARLKPSACSDKDV